MDIAITAAVAGGFSVNFLFLSFAAIAYIFLLAEEMRRWQQ